jgi:energy-coupling factor transport system permease protein
MRASTASVLDRALDVAAALEVRGYGAARRPQRASAAYSRHDIAFLVSALAIVALAIGARLNGVAAFRAYPSLHAPVHAGTLFLAGALVLAAAMPFLDRRGISP